MTQRTGMPLAEPAPACPPVDEVLELLALGLDGLLERIPEGGLEARRLITRELHFEPRAEQLESIVRVARDGAAAGPRRELPRRLLQLRMAAERELRRLHDGMLFRSTELQRASANLSRLAGAAGEVEDALREALRRDPGLGAEDREYLLQIGDAFSCPVAELDAGAIVADRLAALARAVETGSLRTAAPTLSENETWMIARALSGREGATEIPSPVCVEALALRLAIREELEAWSELPPWSQSNANQRAARARRIERMQRLKSAYDVVAARLQKQQDNALSAGLHKFADEIRRIGRRLFAMHLSMAPILRDPYDDPPADDAADGPGAEALYRLLERSVASDAEETRPAHSGYGYGVRAPAPSTEREPAAFGAETGDSGATDERREKRRLAVLIALAAVLGAASLGLQWSLRGTVEPAPAPGPGERPSALPLRDVRAAGDVLLTQIAGWPGLNDDERRAEVRRLAAEAKSRGYRELYVTSEAGAPVAHWTAGSGVSLLGGEPVPAP